MNNSSERENTSISENIKGIVDSSIQTYIDKGDIETAREILFSLAKIIEDKKSQLGEVLVDNGKEVLEERFGEEGENLPYNITEMLRHIQEQLSNEFDEILLLTSTGRGSKSEDFYPAFLLSSQKNRFKEDKEKTKKDLENDVHIFIENSAPENSYHLAPIVIGQGQDTTFDALIKITDNYILCFNNSEKDMLEIEDATGNSRQDIEAKIETLATKFKEVINLTNKYE